MNPIHKGAYFKIVKKSDLPMMSDMDRSSKPHLIQVNYAYFGLFFALLLFTTVCSIILKENLIGSRFFFLFHAIGQATLEIFSFIFGAWLVRRLLGRLCYWMFIGITFIAATLHIIDFFLDRVLDLSVFHTIAFVFDESFENFLLLLDASGVPLWMWALFFALLTALPLIGMALYKVTEWLTRHKPIYVQCEFFLQSFVCIPAALLFWDFGAAKMIHPDAYTTFRKSLPWKQTFFCPKCSKFESGKLALKIDEQEIVKQLDTIEPVSSHKPSIFLFVAESLREDFVTKETAPNLTQFREKNIQGSISLSNANSTMISWFSIFHSQFPFLWNATKQSGWKMGSPALALFKKLGYKIRVYSAAQLGYYGMHELIFGKNQSLVDSFQIFEHTAPKPACKADFDAVTTLQKELRENKELQEGHLCIIFLDSTHFDYSWPKDTPAKFTPFGSEISYFQAYQSSKNIELIKNRYRNAIHYIDSLFGKFLQDAPKDALIVFTADHGEEFFDQGHLFHNSHLSKSQTSIPLYMKVKGEKKTVPLLCQMDIMPTLLSAIVDKPFPFLQGESALKEKTWPFVTIARFNAGRSPYEWCLHNGESKLTLQFDNRKNIRESDVLHILSLRSSQDTSLHRKKTTDAIIQESFKEAFERLFIQK